MLNFQRYYNVRKIPFQKPKLSKYKFSRDNFDSIAFWVLNKSVTVLPTLSSEHARNTHAYHHLSLC